MRSGIGSNLRSSFESLVAKKCAFTLAEVLITLVIIGVVAALTIPNLMTKYQQHVFENQFKKSLYTISQIVARTRSELGVSRLGAYCSEYDSNNGGYYNAATCRDALNQHIFKDNTKQQMFSVPGSSLKTAYNISRDMNKIKTYNNKNTLNYVDGSLFSIQFVNQMPDGSFFGFNVNNSVLFFGVDLNGYKKPNRLGYDIFIFSLNNKNDTISSFLDKVPTNVSDSDFSDLTEKELIVRQGTSCNLHSERAGNGLGCSYYALRNKCPYDDTKTYWECLK